MLVMKFGGTSVGDGRSIAAVADIVQAHVAEGQRVVVVVSAMSGVTDDLIRAARSAASGDAETYGQVRASLLDQHLVAIVQVVSDAARRQRLMAGVESKLADFETLCRSIYILGELTPRALDQVSSLGERFAALIVAAALQERDLEAEAVMASEIVVTDAHFGGASPLMDLTRKRVQRQLLPQLEAGGVPVVTGFISATEDGVITTLGRGGSDYSASILGNCLDADEVWIWTDVDGVMTADPRIVPEARTLAEISYAEAAELSYFGARVLHPKTILPAVEKEIPLRIKNTFNPTHPGTLIVKEPQGDGRTVKAITSIRDLSQVTVEGRGMIGVPGVAARVFSTVADEGISVLMISQSSSEQSICFVIPKDVAPRAIAALEGTFERELAGRDIDRIWAQDAVVIVAVVGAGMKGTPGIAAKVFGALGRNGLNVISIAQGSSEYNLSLVVAESDADEAVRQIHREFELHRERLEIRD